MIHRDLLRAARLELGRLADEEARHLASHPFRLVHRYDPRAGAYAVRVEVVRPLPATVPALAAGVLRETGAALDALAAWLAPREGQAARAPRFPIHESLPEFAQRSRKALAAMSAEAQATIESLQPYHAIGGFRNGTLWLLRELLAAGEPRLAAGAIRGEAAMGVNTLRHVEITGELRAVPGAFEDGAAIASVAARVAGPDPKLDLFLRPDFALAFAAGGPARGAPLVATLGAIRDHVETVVFPRLGG